MGATVRYQGQGCQGDVMVPFVAAGPGTVREGLLELGFSRGGVGRLLARGTVLVNGRVAAAATSLMVGDALTVALARVPIAGGGDAPRCVQVLYEDPFVLAVNKPAGVLVHGDGTGASTLTDAVNEHLRREGALQPAQALQRLDVETTGVVAFSKTEEFQPLFDALVAGGGMTKRYLAVARGAFGAASCVYEDALGRDRHDARRMRVAERGGQSARTFVERAAVAADGSCSLLVVTLGTGRRHQIRVHLAAHGHPLLGDALYGGAGDEAGSLMLHAYEESFTHPLTGEELRLCSGWPRRFSRWFDPSDVRAAGCLSARAL